MNLFIGHSETSTDLLNWEAKNDLIWDWDNVGHRVSHHVGRRNIISETLACQKTVIYKFWDHPSHRFFFFWGGGGRVGGGGV